MSAGKTHRSAGRHLVKWLAEDGPLYGLTTVSFEGWAVRPTGRLLPGPDPDLATAANGLRLQAAPQRG